MYSQWGIVDAKPFKANAALTRKRNQLVKLDTDGTVTPATPAAGGLFFPLKQNVTLENVGDNVDHQISGVASVFVENATDIVAGNIAIVGPTGVGVINGGANKAALAADAVIVGTFQKPYVNTSADVPVLLAPEVYIAPEAP